MDYLKRGVISSWSGMRKHKFLLIILLVLQIVLIISSAAIFIHYQQVIFNDLQNVVNPLQNANFDATSLQEGGEFLEDAGQIYLSYISLKKHIIEFISWIIGLFLVLNGLLWLISQRILQKMNIRQWFNSWLKYIVSSIVIFTPYILIFYYIMRGKIAEGVATDIFSQDAKYFLYAFILVYYLVLVCFAFVNIGSWKKFVKMFFKVGIKKIHWSVLVLIINSALIAGSFYVIYYFTLIKENFLMMIVGGLLSVIILSLTKLYWIASLKELANEKSNY